MSYESKPEFGLIVFRINILTFHKVVIFTYQTEYCGKYNKMHVVHLP